MRKTQFLSIVLALFFALSTLSGQINIPVSNQNTGIKTTEKSIHSYRFKSDIKDIVLSPVATNSGLFHDISLDGYSRSYDEGKPQLPNIRKMIQLPIDGDYNIIINSYEEIIIPLNQMGITQKIMPAQPSYSKSSNLGDIIFKYNQAYYQQNQFNNNPIAIIEEVGISRGVRLANLVINPIQYNPATNTLKILTNIDIKVQFQNHDIFATKSIQEKFFSPAFENRLNDSEMLPLGINKDALSKYPIKYVIVSDPAFQTALQPFIEWKTKKGFYVIEAYTNNPAVGTTTTSIKNYLQNLYITATTADPAPTYVLFVGDVAQVPAYTGTTGSHVTDLYYVTFDGTNDNIPDMYYGRFSATNLAQLQPQIHKTLQYEKFLMPNPSYLDTVVLIAGVDASWSNTHANGQINYIESYYTNSNNGFAHAYKYLYPQTNNTTTAAEIRTNVGKGVGIANYTAHCLSNGWSEPRFVTSDIPAMQNKDKYGLLIGNCCQSNKFNDAECFGEALLRAVDKGAVGYIGGSNNTYWDEDFYWAVGVRTNVTANPTFDPTKLGAYDKWFHTQGIAQSNWYITNGQLSYAGNLSVEASNSSRKKYYWEIYHLMGDPSVMSYLASPTPLTVNYQNPQNVGLTSLTVTTEANAYVAISLNGVLLNAKLADNNGIAELNFLAINTPDTADIVVTKQNRQPFIGSVFILNSSVPNDASVSQIINPTNSYNCPNISIIPEIEVKNMGTNNLTSVTSYYQLNNNTPISFVWTGDIESLESIQIQFPAITLPTGVHTFKSWTSMPNNLMDENLDNDTIYQEISVFDLEIASEFTTNTNYSCHPPLTVQFQNMSENAISYLWDFGDGNTSTEANPSYTYTTNGVYNITLTAFDPICGQNQIIKNSFIQIGLENPIVENIAFCNSGSTELTAIGNGNIKWYQNIDSETELHTGSSYTTPILTETTTYYVQSSIENSTDTVGDSRRNTNGAFFTAAPLHGQYINSQRAGKIKSAIFNSNANKNRTFSLVNMQGDTIEQVTVSIPNGINRIDLDINVPIGTYLLLGPANPNLYRNNSNCSYPYTIDGIFSIDSSTAGSSSLSYYYYFYDIAFQENDCMSERIPVTVSINDETPSAATSILGNVSPCMNSVQTYSTPFISNASAYEWILPSGLSPIGNTTQNTIQVQVNSNITNGLIQVRGINGCGIGDSTTLAINSSPLPSDAGTITGDATICSNISYTYSITPVDNATEYQWTVPTGVDIIGNATSNSITINASSIAQSDTIIVTPINECGQGQSQKKFITILSLPDLTSFSVAPNPICPGSTNVEYTVDGTHQNGIFTWTLPANSSGSSTTNQISINFDNNFTGGILKVAVSNMCGTSVTLEKTLTVFETVAVAGEITGEIDVCQGTANITYTIDPLNNATEYIWTLPLGVEGNSTSNSITVDYTLSAAPGNITVYGKNACYQGESASLTIEVNDLPYVPCTINGSMTVCRNQNNVQYSIDPIANATSYIWTIPNGAIGQSSTNIINIDFTNAMNGEVSVKGVNDCGFGPIINMNIEVRPLPVASFTQSITGNSVSFNNTSQNADSYQWSFGDGNTANIPNPSHVYSMDNTYNVRLIAINNCTSDTTNSEITINTQSIQESNVANFLDIYPNPSSNGNFTLVILTQISEKKEIFISNLLGQIIYKESISLKEGINTHHLNLSEFSKGMYYLIYGSEVIKISIQ
jgi:PKD repeat protein